VAGALPTQATIAPSTSSLVSPNHGRRRHRRQKWLPLQHDHDRIPRTNSGDSVPLVISAVLASDTGHDVPLDRHSDIIASNRPSRRDRLGLTVNSAVVASPTSSLSQTLWPPWPFNMLKRRSEDDTSHIGSSFAKGGADDRPLRPMSAAAVAWSFTKSSAHLGVRSVQEIGSQLWFHSPPAFPPLVVYALWPRRIAVPPPAALLPNQIADNVATSGMLSSLQALVHQTQIPLFSNPLIRNVVGIGTSLALLSWAHAELQRHKRLTPLPLVHQYRDMNRAQLPPFLPDQVFSLAISETAVSSTVPSLTTMPSRANEQNDGPSSRRRHPILVQWEKVRDTMSVRRAWSSWRTKREQTLAMRQNAHRLAVYDELLSLRAAERMHKRQKATTTRLPSSESSKLQQGGQPRAGLHWNPFVLWQRYRSRGSVNIQLENAPPLGHALVTGASAGIGRAIAVELARWKIPLILVARDINALNDLAIDLEACYGVDCAVLSADLSQPGSAERIYEAVTDAGLRVDVRAKYRTRVCVCVWRLS
jgi:short chain dehydrogenase